MAQMNPLIGPKLSKNTILMMAREWVNITFYFILKSTIIFIASSKKIIIFDFTKNTFFTEQRGASKGINRNEGVIIKGK